MMVHDARSLWRPGRVLENRPVADGSMWIVLEAADDVPAAFEPGNVLGLGLKLDDDSLMRHAYTVSRGDPSRRRFEHLYRIVSGGRMTSHLVRLKANDTVYFHGPFHTPIQHEIRRDADRIFLISTGVGIGPLFGYAQKTLAEGEARPLTLYAGFREEAHTCLATELTALARQHPNFAWHFTLTRPSTTWSGLRGRVTESVPDQIDPRDLATAHFHLVGNGEMVRLVESSLHRARVSPVRISIETYFNHYADPSDEDVDQLTERFLQLS
jgi:ferredoxin-NADP reductase